MKGVRENPEKYGFEGYRDWERWCDESLGMTRRNANRFIKVVDRFGDTGVPTLPNTMSVLYELTSFTDEELTREYELPNGEKKKPDDMSRRQIEELKRQLKQAEQEAAADVMGVSHKRIVGKYCEVGYDKLSKYLLNAN